MLKVGHIYRCHGKGAKFEKDKGTEFVVTSVMAGDKSYSILVTKGNGTAWSTGERCSQWFDEGDSDLIGEFPKEGDFIKHRDDGSVWEITSTMGYESIAGKCVEEGSNWNVGNVGRAYPVNYASYDLVYKREVNKKKNMKLNSFMKRLLDEKTKKLVKAGIINGDLQLTSTGKEVLESIIMGEYMEKLVAAADEIIAEEKEEKGCN